MRNLLIEHCNLTGSERVTLELGCKYVLTINGKLKQCTFIRSTDKGYNFIGDDGCGAFRKHFYAAKVYAQTIKIDLPIYLNIRKMNKQEEQKEMKIVAPEGMHINLEAFNKGRIEFTKDEPPLPTTWTELSSIDGFFIDENSATIMTANTEARGVNRNIWATLEMADASVALAQLSQLMKRYNDSVGGLVPHQFCNCIKISHENKIVKVDGHIKTFLKFANSELRNRFIKNFEKLIIKASPLL